MPVTVEIDDPIIVLRMIGIYETSDIRAVLTAALDRADRPALSGLLFDVSRSLSLAVRPADDVRTMGQFLGTQSHRFGRRIALLASADFAYGLMRLGSVTLESEGVLSEVFRDEPAARAWLLDRG